MFQTFHAPSNPFKALVLFVLALFWFAVASPAATPIQHATTPAMPSRSASGNSYNPIFSADGRYLVFVSQANNLVTNDDLSLSLDVFVRDLTNQATTLVSVNTNGIGGGNFDADYPSISSNGQWIVFASAASNLVPNDTNELSDIFVRDMVAGTTRLVSADSNGVISANGKSTAPLISANGRWVIFESTATNLVNLRFSTNETQVYARDLLSNVTYMVSADLNGTKPGDGASESPAISADGRWVAFVGKGTNLVTGVTNRQGEIYLRDLASGTTTLACTNVAEFFADFTNGYRCFNPALSRDGARLAFKAAGSGTNMSLVFWSEIGSGRAVCLASNSQDTSWPELSADGRWLACESGTNVFVWDTQQQTNVLINVGYDGVNPANGPARAPVMSADGRTVLLYRSRTDMVESNVVVVIYKQVYNLYAHSLELSTARLVSANVVGDPSGVSLEYFMPAFSENGRLVAFESADDFLVTGDQNRASDIFVRNLAGGQTELISVRHDARSARTGTGVCIVNPRCISSNGQYALISSSDNGLGIGDTNLVSDLYFLDLIAGTNFWIFVPTNSICSNAQATAYPAMSPNGQQVAFLRIPTTFVQTTASEGFILNSETGALNHFNLNPTGGLALSVFRVSNYEAFSLSSFGHMSFSPDGQRLAFSAQGPNLMNGTGTWLNNIYIFNVATGSNSLITHTYTNANLGGLGRSSLPQFSPDGRWLSFAIETASGLISNAPSGPYALHPSLAWDSQNDDFRYLLDKCTNSTFSPDSHFLALVTYAPATNIYLHDLHASISTNILVSSNARNPSVSMNAETIAFQSLPTNGITHVFAKQMPTDRTELISVAPDGVTPGNGASEPPQMTPDDRFVLFASKASNLVSSDTNGCSDIFLRDRRLGLTYLLSANPKTGRSGNRPSTSPLLSADGSTIIFASLANDLAEADYNDQQDIFVVKLARGDSDADGLDDAWEMAYFGNLAQDGSGDADGDSLKDRDEYRAGTDPTNQSSVLRALAVAPVGGQSTTLLWPAALGRQYQIQFKRSVTDTNWTELSTTVTVTGNTASATDTQAGLDAARFYRILILP